MKTKRIVIFVLCFAMLLPLLLACGEEELWKMNPGTYPVSEGAMLTPSFWTKDQTVLRTAEEIAEINRQNPNPVCFDADGEQVVFSLWDETAALTRAQMQALIDCLGTVPDADTPMYNKGTPLPQSFFTALDENRARDAVPERVVPQPALVVSRTMTFCLPTGDFYSDDPADVYYNANAQSEVFPGDPALLLHESRDGKWVLAAFESFVGWIATEDTAKVKTREEWKNAYDPAHFLIVTGERVAMDETAYPSASSGVTLYMGTKFRLTEPVPEMIGGRSTVGTWVVDWPVRGEDGYLAYEAVPIPVSCDVCPEYLAFTPANIVSQAFKFLGRTYGWGGSNGGSDCSGMVRQIYRCFGIRTPRNSGDLASMNGFETVTFTEDMSEKTRASVMKNVKPGSILQFPGHIMLYLGRCEGTDYVISSVGMLCAPDQRGQENAKIDDVFCVVVTPMSVTRASGKTWLEALLVAQNIA